MGAVPADNDGARLFRIRVPGSEKSTAVTVRMTDESAWIAIGARHRRLPLTVPEAWALFKALADALDTAGEPPAFLSRPVKRDTK